MNLLKTLDRTHKKVIVLAVATILLFVFYALILPRGESQTPNECQDTTIEKGHSCACVYDHEGEIGCLYYDFIDDDARLLKEVNKTNPI